MRDRLTVAELFAMTRYTAVQEEQEAQARSLAAQMRASQEHEMRIRELARMRAQSNSQIAGSLAAAGVPGGGMLLAQHGISPHVLQMAAAMAQSQHPTMDVRLPGLGTF